MPTTTQAKLINRLDEIATQRSLDLVVEPLTLPEYQKGTHILFQTKERFTTILEVALVFFDGGVFNADITAELDILPDNGYIMLQKIEPSQGDRINEFLFLIETALKTYENLSDKSE